MSFKTLYLFWTEHGGGIHNSQIWCHKVLQNSYEEVINRGFPNQNKDSDNK